MKTKTLLSILLLIIISSTTYAQVGINTQNPQETLDVQGSLQVRGQMKFGDTSDSGTLKQVIMSQGNSLPPKWVTLPESTLRLSQTVAKTSKEEGNGYIFGPILGASSTDTKYRKITFVDDGSLMGSNNAEGKPIELLENSEFEDPWVELTQLKSSINVQKSGSSIGINFQGTVQISSLYSICTEVAVGIFLDNKLKSVRTLSIVSSNSKFDLLTIDDIISNVSPKIVNGNIVPYDLRVGVRLRYYYGFYQTNTTDNNYPLDIKDCFVLIGEGLDKLAGKTYQINGSTQTVQFNNGNINTNDFMNRLSFIVNLYGPAL